MTDSNAKHPTECLPLPGLDGSNPLGFLAALGAFRSLGQDHAFRFVRMMWVPSGGTWVPAICDDSGSSLDQTAVLAALERLLANDIAKHPSCILEKLGTDDFSKRRQIFQDQVDQAAVNGRVFVDWLAALASDFAAVEAINQLQTTRRDYYYGNLKSVIERTKSDHLRRSIFVRWDYADPLDNQSLHLDPTEDRRHAHQWNKPAGDPDRKKYGGMLGANRLAIEAIPLFTSFPEGGTLCTLGFTGNRSNDTRWTWPIWQPPLNLDSARSLLSLAAIQARSISSEQRRQLHERGISAVFRSSRILVQKTPNFTPAHRIA